MIVIDGNDGTGKSTLAEGLRALGFVVVDRGLPTRATDHGVPPSQERPSGERYLILDVPVEECQRRLLLAGKSLTERYHTPEDLAHYRGRFIEVARDLGVTVLDGTGTPAEVLARALERLGAAGGLRVGVPKGRLRDGAVDWLRTRGYDLSGMAPRALVATVRKVTFSMLKPRALPQLVALGFLDAGLCGRDLVMESGYDDRLRVVRDLGLAPVVLCVGAADPDLLERPPQRPIVIATEFPFLASRWAFGRGLAHICLNSWGSTEAWAPAFADIVIDVVETGATMEANGLTVVEAILESSMVLFERATEGLLPHTEFGLAAAEGRSP